MCRMLNRAWAGCASLNIEFVMRNRELDMSSGYTQLS